MHWTISLTILSSFVYTLMFALLKQMISKWYIAQQIHLHHLILHLFQAPDESTKPTLHSWDSMYIYIYEYNNMRSGIYRGKMNFCPSLGNKICSHRRECGLQQPTRPAYLLRLALCYLESGFPDNAHLCRWWPEHRYKKKKEEKSQQLIMQFDGIAFHLNKYKQANNLTNHPTT